jgi:diguanylate cyclase (GGDEF)-like protein
LSRKQRSRTRELANFIKEQDTFEGGNYTPYEEETDKTALRRLRLVLGLLLIYCPLAFAVDYLSYGIEFFRGSLTIHVYSAIALALFLAISFLPQFRRNSYVFAFLLALLTGVHVMSLHFTEHSSWTETLAKFSLFIALMGFLLPWGGYALFGICLPLYLFYPLTLALDNSRDVWSVFSLQSNLYLGALVFLTIMAATIHEAVRGKEFHLKLKLESENTKLQDYQLRLERAYQRMEKLALQDPLTNAFNRVHLTQWLKEDVYRNPACKQRFSVIMFDLDHFKEVNDQGGHQRGDDVLKIVVQTAKEKIGQDGMIFRYGGDEFCIILPGAELLRGLRIADNLRYSVEQHPDLFLETGGPESVHLTLSLGVTTQYVAGTIDADYLIRWVDAALMESKRQGRNTISVFDPAERKVISAVDWLAKVKEEGHS